jgi:putative ABC transport system permease protein
MSALVIAQVAMAIVLGVGAGLMLRSLWNLQRVDPGFDATQVLTFRLQTTSKYNTLTNGLPYFEQVVARLRALPGVTSVGSIQHLPMTGYNWAAYVHPVERPPAPNTTAPRVTWRFIGWDYFAAMRIPLRMGRLFTEHDRVGAPAVAIVNDAFARREFGSAAAAVGARLVSTSGAGKETVEIVGVTGDVRSVALDQPAHPEIYRPLAQTFMFPMAFVVRTTGDPAAAAAAVREATAAVDPIVPVAELQSLPSLIAGSLGRPRLLAMLLTVFAAVGVALSVVGVYGTVAFRVRQIERELGIRLALGARPGTVAQRVVRQGAAYAGAGLAIGVPVALGLGGLLQGLVYGITPRDPLTFVALPLAVVATTLAACLLPARRAARVDPVQTLRGE